MQLKRLIDILAAGFLGALVIAPALLIALLIKSTTSGPILYWSDRVGRNNSLFRMPKFRTMRIGTPVVATDLLSAPEKYLTPIGKVLRKTSLDELPQLWSILKGDMSLVGPRPALYNQQDLIDLRTHNGVHQLFPGLTGLAQISGRDDISLVEKVRLDTEYMEHYSIMLDIKILWLTFIKVVSREGVSH